MDWFPWYPALYRADTMHLTAEQDGIYRRLIDHYMETRSPLPDNDYALARICGVSVECFEHASSIVRAFFQHKKDGFLYHKRCEMELEAQDNKAKTRTTVAKNAAEKRWNKQKDKCTQHANSMPSAMLGDATRQDKTRESKKEYTSDFLELWNIYPRKDGSKSDAFKSYQKAVKETAHETIIAGLKKYAEANRGKDVQYIAHATTWLNGKRWEAEYASQPAKRGEIKRNVAEF
jgi:uncharacterized protein YdaU (DUF1376 family)